MTSLLCLGVTIKALYLFYSQGRMLSRGETPGLYNWFFACVASGAVVVMFKAITGDPPIAAQGSTEAHTGHDDAN